MAIMALNLLATSYLLFSTPTLALPGPTDISKTYSPNPLSQVLHHLFRRQFTGGAILQGFTGPPPDRCYHRPDTLPACPYGGQCRPDQHYTCDTYCQNYGKDLDMRFSCNLPCSYESTGLKGEKPRNPMHCATPSQRSPLKCDSGWACYRQFSEAGPDFEQRPPVCSPVYELCRLPGVVGLVDNSTVGASLSAAVAPLVSLSIPSASGGSEEIQEGSEAASSSLSSSSSSTPSSELSPTPRKRQLVDACSTGLTCIEDPRPSLGLPPNRVARIGICVKVESTSSCDQSKWDSCGEEGHCAKDPTAARGDVSAPGRCVRLLGDDWRGAGNGTFGGMRRSSGLVRRC